MTQRKSSSPSEEELDRRHIRWMFIIDSCRKVVLTAFIGFWAWAVVYAGFYLPVKESAGQQTIITVAQNWVVDANIHVYLAWGAAAGGVAYGWNERRKRLRERKAKDERIIQLERKLDPNRTSSGLTTEGEQEGGQA